MSPVLMVIVALAAPPSEARDAAPSVSGVVSAQEQASTEKTEGPVKKAETAPRKGVKLREAIRLALRRWARPTDAEADAAAREFLVLYKELGADDQLSRSQRQYFQNKVRIRLARLSDQIALRVARQKRLAEARASKKGGSTDAERTTRDADSPGATSPDQAAGVAPGGQAFGGGAFQPADHGRQLVDLIQTVIRPETWDVNGGLGSIYYWYPGRALVIRQTDEVHGEIGGVLGQLRRAGP